MKKIKQIIPCKNWWAIFEEDGKEAAYAVPCLALDEDGEVYFLDTDLHGIFQDPTEIPNFKRVIYSSKDLSSL